MLEGCVPWPEEFVKEYREKGYWQDLTLGEALEQWVAKYGDRPALVFQSVEVSFSQMEENVTKLAYQLTKIGLRTYDRVVFQLLNVPDLVYLFYACMKIGAIPICSLPTHRMAEIGHFAKSTDARAHAIPAMRIKDFDFEQFADQVSREAPSLEFVLCSGKPERPSHISITELIQKPVNLAEAKQELKQFRPDPMEPAVFQLSGGTTGVPKICPRTHNDYYHNAVSCAAALGLDQDSRALVCVPMMHNAPMVSGMLPLHSTGGCVALLPALRPEPILQGIETNKANMLFTVPVFIHLLLDVPEDERSKYDLSSIKRLVWGGNPVPAEIQKKFRETFHCDSDQVFGMAEGMISWTRPSDPLEVKLNTQGRPVSEGDEVRIVDVNTGSDLPPGEVGELLVRGPYTIRGYHKAEERNREVFTADGYYRTGDLMKKDEGGNLIFAGRLKDCISRGVEKINAEEVEGHINAFSKVKAAAVVAMPDKVMGERACAFIVPEPGETFTLEELSEFLLTERQIAKFKLPEKLEFVDELPITKVGKFEKKSLREKVTSILEKEGSI